MSSSDIKTLNQNSIHMNSITSVDFASKLKKFRSSQDTNSEYFND